MSDWKNVQYKDGKMRTSEGGGGGGSSTFADLDDVSFNNLQNGQVPKYNSTTQKWENADESGGGGTVTDVTVDGISVVNQQGVAEINTPDADGVSYDNQQSGLSATDVQGAIDELAQGSGGGGVEDVEVNGTSVVNAQKVAEIKSYKEVTQAEYQALPSSKLTDNILYCIKDSAGADGFPPLIYSDEEREVGVWRDGKPLYQKTVYCGDFTTSGNKSVAHNISNLDKVVMMYGTFNEGTTRFPLPIVMWGSAVTYQTRLAVNNTNVIISRDTAAQSVNLYVTLQYTKTTDTAGSGIWTTQGGYAHHYSTSEKVVGTWVDGKPLYEKTLQKTFSTRDQEGNTSYYHGNVDISSDIPNLKHGFVVVDASYYGTYPNERGFTFGYVEPDGMGLVLGTLFERVNFTGYVTVRYTKTTD